MEDWVCLVAVCSMIIGLQALPTGDGGWAEIKPFSEQDYKLLLGAPAIRYTETLPAGFKTVYVNKHGAIAEEKSDTDPQIPVHGSPGASMPAVREAARVIHSMIQFMPNKLYAQLASKTYVGIFTKTETMTVYPHFSLFANGNCGTSCTGACAVTCSSDGRKWETVAGIGSMFALALEENLMCGDEDPYRHGYNVLIHEFSHTIHYLSSRLPVAEQINQAYEKARANKTWDLASYAMRNSREYFAEAATTFLGVNHFHPLAGGGMNECGGHYCASERDARLNLKKRDRELFEIMSYIFTTGHPKKESHLRTCPSNATDAR